MFYLNQFYLTILKLLQNILERLCSFFLKTTNIENFKLQLKNIVRWDQLVSR